MTLEVGLIQALWFIFPAYVANSMPVQLSKVKALEKYGKPIDGGRTFQGIRILGDGKTWRGLFVGVGLGTLAGVCMSAVQSYAANYLGFTLPTMTPALAFALSAGTITGDMVASFFKRRTGLNPGDSAPLLDQLDFVFGAFFFSWLLLGNFDQGLFVTVVVITPVIHLFANFVAWLWKLKKNPW